MIKKYVNYEEVFKLAEQYRDLAAAIRKNWLALQFEQTVRGEYARQKITESNGSTETVNGIIDHLLELEVFEYDMERLLDKLYIPDEVENALSTLCLDENGDPISREADLLIQWSEEVTTL